MEHSGMVNTSRQRSGSAGRNSGPGQDGLYSTQGGDWGGLTPAVVGYDVDDRGADLTFRAMEGHEWEWFNRFLPVLWVEDSRGIVAQRGQELVGGCVYDNWTLNSVQCHLLILDPFIIRRGWLQTIFTAAFGTSRQYIYGLVPGDNTRALRLNVRMGFTVKAELEEGYAPGVGYVIMQMRRQDCPYIEENTRG